MDEFQQTLEMLRQALRLQLRVLVTLGPGLRVIERMSHLQFHLARPALKAPAFEDTLGLQGLNNFHHIAEVLCSLIPHLIEASTQLLSSLLYVILDPRLVRRRCF